MERRWATALAERGSIRIGTLADFRRQEAHRSAIGDRHEGQMTYKTGFDYRPPDGMDTPFLKIGGSAQGSIPIVFDNIAFETQSDAYIFCFASSPSAGNLPQQYDTTIGIADPMAFCDAITKSFARRDSSIDFVALKQCVYEERSSFLTEPMRDDEWYRKPSEFAAQSEYRAAWAIAGKMPQAPLDIEIPELACLVKIHEP